MASAPLDALPLAVLLEFVSGMAGAVLVITGVAAGGLRAWAVLTYQSNVQVEWATAVGFCVGATLAILIVVIDFGLGVS